MKMNTKPLLDRCRTISTGMLRYWIQTRFARGPKYRTMDRLIRTKTDNASTIGIKIFRTINTNISKMHVKLPIENSHKMIMKGSKMEPKGSQMATKMEPKGCQMATRMAHKPIQNDPGTLNWTSPAKFQFWYSFWMHLGLPKGPLRYQNLPKFHGKAIKKSIQKMMLKKLSF